MYRDKQTCTDTFGEGHVHSTQYKEGQERYVQNWIRGERGYLQFTLYRGIGGEGGGLCTELWASFKRSKRECNSGKIPF